MLKYHNHNRLNCFSPPVMIVTFMIEMGLAMFVVWKYRSVDVVKVIAATLVCLATFQLAEWMVCQGAVGISSIDWAKIGFVAISFLPPLGIHVSTLLAGRPNKLMVVAGYGSAVAFGAYFLLATQGISGSVCGGNYVIFKLAPQAVNFYTMYYYSLLIFGTGLALFWASKVKDKYSSSALRGLAMGYLSFMLPTIFVYQLNNQTSAGIPSIMCGFAVSLALALVFWVLPKHLESSQISIQENRVALGHHKT